MLNNTLNNGLSKELTEKIKSISCDVFSIDKNDPILKEGEQTDYIYFIEHGSITLKKKKDDADITFLELPKGELLGVDCVYTDGICNYSAIASSTTNGMKILISDFITLVRDHKKASLELMKYLSSILIRLEKNL